MLHGLGVGGAEVLAARLVRRLDGDYRFVFACLDELGTLGERLRSEGFPIHVLGRRPGFDWRCSRRLAGILRRERVDLIHAHQYAPFFYGALARLGSGRPPILFTEHGRPHPDAPRPKRIAANRLLLRRRDRVVGVGRAVRRALIANEGIPGRRASVIYNGIDPGVYGAAPDPRDRLAIREEMGIGPDELIVMQVARLDCLKDHATAVRAMSEVARHRGDARLVLVGEGPEEAAIRDQVRRHGIGPLVRLLGLRGDVPRLLAAADVILLTSISEGIPLTLIEGMAAGLPVVATRVGGVAEVVEEGRTGLLAAAGDHGALAAAIVWLAGDSGLRRSMGRLGRERAEAVFAEGRMNDEYRRAYGEMIRSAPGAVGEGRRR